MVARGIRNNNPGNLEASSWTRSQPGYVGSDGRFAIFDTMANGIAAQVSLLGSYIRRGYDTVAEIINRYGNDPGPQDDVSVRNYIGYVAGRLGVNSNSPLSQSQAGSLAQAMREFETGNQARGIIGDASSIVGRNFWDTLNEGSRLADEFRRDNPLSGTSMIDPNMDSGIWGWLRYVFTGEFAGRFAAVTIGIIIVTIALIAFILSSNRTEIISNG